MLALLAACDPAPRKTVEPAASAGAKAGGDPEPSARSDEAGASRDRIVVATDAAFPPFHERTADGAIVGYDIDVVREALRRGGLECEVRVVRPYAALFDGLLSGSHDVVAATTGITPERRERFRFSPPYFKTCQAVIVRIGPGEPNSLAELEGRRVGAAGDGTSARALTELKGVTPVKLEGGADGVPALLERRIDAFIIDEFEAVPFARARAAELRVLPEPAALESYGLVTAPGRGRLWRVLNAAIDEMSRDGTLDRLRAARGLVRGDDWPVRLPP